ALQRRTALAAIVSKTGWTLLGELRMTLRISEVAACCSSASPSFFSRSRARAFSFFISAVWDSSDKTMRVLAFVPVERSLRPRVGLFAPLRDKVTSSAQSLVPSGQPSLAILTEPHDELASPHSIISSPLFAERDVMECLTGMRT